MSKHPDRTFALADSSVGEIETASSAIKVHGGRMNEEQMKVVDETGATQ